MLAKLWLRFWSIILVEMSAGEVVWLFWPAGHLALLSNRRSSVIVARVRLMAGLFAVLTPLWIVIDVMVYPPEVWHALAWVRLATSVGFGAILLTTLSAKGLFDTYKVLAFLLAIPSIFFLYTYEHLAQFDLHGLQGAVATAYTFLPYVMLAGLSIFPLTLIECGAFALPLLLMPVVAVLLNKASIDYSSLGMTLWLQLLIVSISALAGLSQLAFMIVFIRESIRDTTTGCFTRNSGEELLQLQFVLATRVHAPLALAFIDLDHFKRVNDTFGHDTGDTVLKEAAQQLRTHLRAGDVLVRWGGEEFLLIMPNATTEQACQGMERVCEIGLGQTPDNQRVTASIGVAERVSDDAWDWTELVVKADSRMYEAKQAGRNRIVGCDRPIPPK